MVVLRTHAVRIHIVRFHRQCRFQAVEGEVVHRVVQQAVANRVRETETVHIVLDHLHAHPVIARLAALTAQVDLQNVVMKLIQEVGTMPVHRYPARRLAGQRMARVRHRKVAMVTHLVDHFVDTVLTLLHQLIVDVDRCSVLRILVTARIHLHTKVMILVRSQPSHIRHQLATRQHRILDVENGGVVGQPCNRYGIVTALTPDKRGGQRSGTRRGMRIQPLFKRINNPIETGLLEPDVHPRAGIQRAQPDQCIFAIHLGEGEHAAIGTYGILLHDVPIVEARLHVHETKFIKRIGGGIPRDTVGGIFNVKLQVNPFTPVIPAVHLQQIEPVVGILCVVDDRVRIHVGTKHQERQLTAVHFQGQDIAGQMPMESAIDILVFISLDGVGARNTPFGINAQGGVTTSQQDGGTDRIKRIPVRKDLVAYLQVTVIGQLPRRNFNTVLFHHEGNLTSGIGIIICLELHMGEKLRPDRNADRHIRSESHQRMNHLFRDKINGIPHQGVINAIAFMNQPKEHPIIALLVHSSGHHII